jgi:hypothetical protein
LPAACDVTLAHLLNLPEELAMNPLRRAARRPLLKLSLLAVAACHGTANANGVDKGDTLTLWPGFHFGTRAGTCDIFNCDAFIQNRGTIINEVPYGRAGTGIDPVDSELRNDGSEGEGFFRNRNGGAFLIFGSMRNINGGIFFNTTGAQLQVLSAGVIFQDGQFYNASGSKLYNQTGAQVSVATKFWNYGGALTVNEGSGTSFELGVGGSLRNFEPGSVFDSRAGASISLANSSLLSNEAGATFSNRGAGTRLVSAGGNLVNAGNAFNQDAAQMTFASGRLTNQAAGQFTNLGAGTVLSLAGGQGLRNTGQGTLLTNSGGASLQLKGLAVDFINEQGARLQNSGASTSLQLGSGSELNNGVGAQVLNLSGARIVIQENANLLNLTGATFLNDGAGSTVQVDFGGRFFNGGTFTNQNKALADLRTLNNLEAGQYLNSGGATTTLGQGLDRSVSHGRITNTGSGSSFSIGLGGQLSNQGGPAQLYNTVGAQWSVSGTGAALENTTAASLVNSGSGSAFAVSLGAAFSNRQSATVNNAAGGEFSVFAATARNESNARITNEGAGSRLLLSFSTLTNSAQIANRNAALFEVGNTSTFSNEAGGHLANETGATLKLMGTLNNDGRIDNAARLTMVTGAQVSGNGVYSQTDTAAVTELKGHWTQGSTQLFGGSFSGTGTVGGAFINGAGVLAQAGGISFSGAVSGSGIFNGPVRFEGSLDPGFGLGSLTVIDAVLAGSNRLNIEIGGHTRGGNYDTVNGGAIQLGGTLAVKLLPIDFVGTPLPLALEDSFDLLAGDSLRGDFSSFELPTLAPGLGWTHQIVTTTGPFLNIQSYRLSVTAVPEPSSLAMLLAGLGLMGGWRKRAVRRGRPAPAGACTGAAATTVHRSGAPTLPTHHEDQRSASIQHRPAACQ